MREMLKKKKNYNQIEMFEVKLLYIYKLFFFILYVYIFFYLYFN